MSSLGARLVPATVAAGVTSLMLVPLAARFAGARAIDLVLSPGCGDAEPDDDDAGGRTRGHGDHDGAAVVEAARAGKRARSGSPQAQ